MSDIFINLPIHHNNLLVHILEESKTIVCQMDAVMQSEYNMQLCKVSITFLYTFYKFTHSSQ
jgi:hypothetical protein